MSKRFMNPNWKREEILDRRRRGKKTVSHGSYRAKRKPTSPRILSQKS